tara:strand:+ start:141 stop:458 length:318 start_codon:yes stop_codon:yes gene_type:complete
MIITIVTFNLPTKATLQEITAIFQGTAPKYLGMHGLIRKNYWLSEDGNRAGGIYLWESRADAEKLYTPEWNKVLEEKYGSPPIVEYIYSPVMVDNIESKIATITN